MALPSLRGSQSANCVATASGTASLVLPSSILDGEIGVVVLSSSSTAATATTPTGWTLKSGPDDNSNVLRTWLYTRTMAATDSGTTLNITLTSSRWTIGVAVASDVTAIDSIPAVVTNSTLGTTNAMVLPSLAPASGQCFGVLVNGAQRPFANTDGGTAPSTYTEVQDSSTGFSGASDFTAYVAWKATVSSGGQGTGSWAGSSRSNVYVVVLAPSAPTWSSLYAGGGTLANTGTPAIASTGALGGGGTVTPTGHPAIPGTVALSGSGSLAGAGVPTPTDTAALSGSGTLAGAGTPAPTSAATLAGSGTLGLAGIPGDADTASLTGSGTLTASGTPTPATTVPLSGSGSLTLTGTPAVTGDVALAGTGTLTSVATVALVGQATLAGTGTLTLLGVPTFAVGATLSGAGTLTATGFEQGDPPTLVTITGPTGRNVTAEGPYAPEQATLVAAGPTGRLMATVGPSGHTMTPTGPTALDATADGPEGA